MSNSKVNQYKEIYSQLISKVAELHNRNLDYSKNLSYMGKKDIRRMLKELKLLVVETWKLSNDAYNENQKINKETPRKYKIDPVTGKKIYVYPNRRPKKSPLG
jgi:hypothetical protein